MTLGIAHFLTTIIDFILVALVIFLMIKAIKPLPQEEGRGPRPGGAQGSHQRGAADGDPYLLKEKYH